uniref:Reverse transcriptase n=1 Tax=Sander lucioperca TaxID=283035 RepID=A0A8C9ZBI3_SANLU
YYVSKAIDDFLLFNQTDSISPSILWETLKVVLRGQIISFSASRNKERSFSGFKINYSKSTCFPINEKARQIRDTDLPFRISQSGFKYLGIHITPSFSGLFDANFTPILEKLKSDLQRWSAIYLSLAGRVNCVKMNVLPRFLYLFQSLPVFLPKSFFRAVDKLLSHFLWGGKTSRLRKKFLEKPRQRGGLALPNLMIYYWAANLQKIVYWFQSPETDWCSAEANFCKLASLAALITSKLPLSPSRFSSSPEVKFWASIFKVLNEAFDLALHPSPTMAV